MAQKRICLIGITGDGKSTLGNVMLGYQPTHLTNNSMGFQTGPGAKSCTGSPHIKQGHWLGDTNTQ
jgi:ABC-type transport system involved in cytochrome bd biosynthesis fused ATPase/permease subunit